MLPNRLGPADHSGLMFQPNVGTPCWARYGPLAKSGVATGSTAKTLSSSTRLRAAWTFFDACVKSSYSAATTSSRPNTPPSEFTISKYALVPSTAVP